MVFNFRNKFFNEMRDRFLKLFNFKTRKLNILTILIVSILFGIAFSIPVYVFISKFFAEGTYIDGSQSRLAAFLVSAFMFIILILSGIVFNRAMEQREYTDELRNFRKFTDALHNVSSEQDIYKTLHSFVSRFPSISNSVVLSRNDSPPGENEWTIFPESSPVCGKSISECNSLHQGCEIIRCPYNKLISSSNFDLKYRNGSSLCIPISDSVHFQGILQIYSSKYNFFNNKMVAMLKSYVEVTKMALNNKKSLQLLNKQASTDRLTKLYNRSFLDTFLENQIKASALSEHRLSLIAIDVDHFKTINDTYGHTAGDHVLTLASQAMLQCLRKSDLVARFGGDEFIAVLPETSTKTAYAIAERIRRSIEEINIPPIDGVNIPKITSSLGVSTYPDFCDSKHSLIRTADIALYKAKHNGRNRSMVYTLN